MNDAEKATREKILEPLKLALEDMDITEKYKLVVGVLGKKRIGSLSGEYKEAWLDYAETSELEALLEAICPNTQKAISSEPAREVDSFVNDLNVRTGNKKGQTRS